MVQPPRRSAVGLDLVADGVVRVGARRAARRRRRAWPRRTSSGGPSATGGRSGRPGAGTPCRACGRPRPGRGSGRRRGRPSCGSRGPAGVRAWRSTTCALPTPRACSFTLTPPYATPTRRSVASATCDEVVGTCCASSRVGTSTSAGGRRVVGSHRSTIGRANARVLPEPVGDRASMSRPAIASRMTRVWIGERFGRYLGSRAHGSPARKRRVRRRWWSVFDSFGSGPRRQWSRVVHGEVGAAPRPPAAGSGRRNEANLTGRRRRPCLQGTSFEATEPERSA